MVEQVRLSSRECLRETKKDSSRRRKKKNEERERLVPFVRNFLGFLAERRRQELFAFFLFYLFSFLPSPLLASRKRTSQPCTPAAWPLPRRAQVSGRKRESRSVLCFIIARRLEKKLASESGFWRREVAFCFLASALFFFIFSSICPRSRKLLSFLMTLAASESLQSIWKEQKLTHQSNDHKRLGVKKTTNNKKHLQAPLPLLPARPPSQPRRLRRQRLLSARPPRLDR